MASRNLEVILLMDMSFSLSDEDKQNTEIMSNNQVDIVKM